MESISNQILSYYMASMEADFAEAAEQLKVQLKARLMAEKSRVIAEAVKEVLGEVPKTVVPVVPPMKVNTPPPVESKPNSLVEALTEETPKNVIENIVCPPGGPEEEGTSDDAYYEALLSEKVTEDKAPPKKKGRPKKEAPSVKEVKTEGKLRDTKKPELAAFLGTKTDDELEFEDVIHLAIDAGWDNDKIRRYLVSDQAKAKYVQVAEANASPMTFLDDDTYNLFLDNRRKNYEDGNFI